MVDFLVDNPLLVVFLVIGIGAAAGRVRAWGVALGPAAALFAGLAIGAIDERISELGSLGAYQTLGLVLFTYTVGLASGPTFFAGLRRGGLRAVVVVTGLVILLGLVCTGIAALLDLAAADRAGLFAGATTNTPALQAADQAVASGNPTVAYSLAYPSAVASMILVITLLLRRVPLVPRSLQPPAAPAETAPLVNWTVEIARTDLPPLGELRRYESSALRFSRFEHDGTVGIATDDVALVPGDKVSIVGPEPAVEELARVLGRRSHHHLALDRSTLDFRRMVVSAKRMAGVPIGQLDLERRFGAQITRVRRGDTDLVARDDMALQLGDRVRVVGQADRLPDVARFLGDSDRSLAEVDAVGFALGITAGLAIGAVVVPLPGGIDIALGAGGGPLVAGLVLGVRARTGPVTWQIPQAANLVLRQLGILMFLACAGLRSGTVFVDALGTSRGLQLAVAGLVVAAAFALVVAVACQAVLRADGVEAAGLLSGIETQPAALAYASAQTHGSERVAAAYALVFPMAMIVKIVVVQFLV